MPDASNSQIRKIENPSNIEGFKEKIKTTEKDVEELALPEKRAEGAAIEIMQEAAAGKSREQAAMPGGIIAAGQSDIKQAQREKEIEKILEEGLSDIYASLPANKQREFRAAGEQTIKKINELFNKGKATIRRIINLIREWLAQIPGVNKFFLEQEAKIKADKIFKINHK